MNNYENHTNSVWAPYKRYRRNLTLSQIGANLAGAVTVTSYFAFFHPVSVTGGATRTFTLLALMFPVLVLIAATYSTRWEREVNRFVESHRDHQPVSDRLQKIARRKIMDQPFVSAALTALNWSLATVVMIVNQYLVSSGLSATDQFWSCLSVLIGVLISGCVTVAIVFLSTEHQCRRIRPYFFPEGGSINVAGIRRLPLSGRMLVIFILTSILPVTLMAVLSFNKTRVLLLDPTEDVMTSLLQLTLFVLVVTVALAIVLSRYFASGILNPIGRMEAAMQKVATGDFQTVLPVDSNDELGALSHHFNRMTAGLKEREQMKLSLELAKEVQQSLIPASDPSVGGLDISGSSIYCEETGGDYLDYLDEKILGENRYGIVVGDVSGHGLPSALMMATVRAALRQRAALPGSVGDVMTDVNRQFSQDVEETGGFVTLFFIVIDTLQEQLTWVRAGHDPAVIYDAADERFEELAGEGIAIGLQNNSRYSTNHFRLLKTGQIILLGTDGIWETRNPAGDMFGKQPVRDIIQRNHRAGARTIRTAILNELAQFRQKSIPEDDVTLVVIKIVKEK
jgi:sigma-B regulation protein RsbU (phosphoserine phosphatase)